MVHTTVLLRLLPLALFVAHVAASEGTCCATKKTVNARGVSYAEIVQNVTTVTVSVDASGPTAFGVQISIGDGIAAVTEFLASQGDAVSNVQMTGSRLYPQYNYDYGENGSGYTKTFSQYTANARVSFDLGVIVADVLDGLAAVNGATIDNISKREAYEDLLEAQRVAVKNAVFEARQNAERMVAGLGGKLGEAVNIHGRPNDYLMSGGGSLQVVRAEATVIFEFA